MNIQNNKKEEYLLAFDTANKVISIGIGVLNKEKKQITLLKNTEVKGFRASNTKLIPAIDNLVNQTNINKNNIKSVACGRGPGSFTGVRICMSTAKGIASALCCPLIGFSTLDSIAWNAWLNNVEGHLLVLADAMREEIYPALYLLDKDGIHRKTESAVLKLDKCITFAEDINKKFDNLYVCGDSLDKYKEEFELFDLLDSTFNNPSGTSNVKTIESMWKFDKIDPYNKVAHNPTFVLPIYTRLSDAEETERIKLADTSVKNLNSGVKNLNNENSFSYTPMDAKYCDVVSSLCHKLMKHDSWTKKQFEDDLAQRNRTWWTASNNNNEIIGFAGAVITGDTCELLKIGVDKNYQRRQIATNLISKIANDARDLGAKKLQIEVRSDNLDAIKFYDNLKLKKIRTRSNYYKDKTDALILEGSLPIINHDVGGMKLKTSLNSTIEKKAKTTTKENNFTNLKKPIILSIETSCDETAAAITSGDNILSDSVASQIDFHKRFGGVVPEIASRKHIESICGVVDVCFEEAGVTWDDIDSVAATYTPGLVGALVVGMSYAKGAAWAKSLPFIGVNHLEGHLYANKLAEKKIEFPAIASILSGGNTMLVLVEQWGSYKTLGSTIDDAVGEAFDKVAKALELGYPGGPIISKLAEKGNPKEINFPRALIKSNDFKFSLSGLKTAVIYYIEKHKDAKLEDICASFQQAVIDVQVEKAKNAVIQTGAKCFMFGGGVAANKSLRSSYKKMCDEINLDLIVPPLSATGDNAAMIGLVAVDRFKNSKFFNYDSDVSARSPIDNPY